MSSCVLSIVRTLGGRTERGERGRRWEERDKKERMRAAGRTLLLEGRPVRLGCCPTVVVCENSPHGCEHSTVSASRL